ncbi:MAG: FAD:protein FMN transferase [Acidimicrobiales bacterium]
MSLSAELADEVVAITRAMATDVTMRAVVGDPASSDTNAASHKVDVTTAVEAAIEVFHEVERSCTRFDPNSPLMRANTHPTRWHQVPPVLFEALVEASRAHEYTRGIFDPRVLVHLVALGYDRTLPFSTGSVETNRSLGAQTPTSGIWRPRFRAASREVHLRGQPVELGGIGKGLAIRWASELLGKVAPNHLIEAGGDCFCAGRAPDDRAGWRIGIEDPLGGDEPVAVLRCEDRAVATSSIRVRRWTAGGRTVHHLIDPRTGRPGGGSLRAVTVVHRDPAVAEVWAKTLFLAGSDAIAALARRRNLAAVWVDESSRTGHAPASEAFLIWSRQ